MRFLNDLAKKIIRSAVNQTDSDPDRVVSTKIYKDRRPKSARMVSKVVVTTNIDYQRHSQYHIDFLTRQWYNYLSLLICSILFLPFSWIYYLFKSFIYFNKRTVSAYTFTEMPVYVPNGTHTTVSRIEGYKTVKIKHELPTKDRSLNSNKLKAQLYFIIAIIMTCFAAAFWTIQSGKIRSIVKKTITYYVCTLTSCSKITEKDKGDYNDT